MNYYLLGVVAYLLVMIGMGIYFAKNEVKSEEDFMVAGRSLPLWIVIGTLIATFVGSGTIVGGASFTYQYGPLASIFNMSGGFFAAIILFFIADKIRAREIFTIPELIENRFGLTARIISSILILFAYIGITAYQLTGGAHILQLTLGTSLETGAVIMCVVVIFLTVSGGLFSVAYTDAASAILIIIGLLIAIPFVLIKAGGIDHVIELMPANTKTLSGGLSPMQLLGYFLPLFLLALGDQNMYQRFSASKTPRIAKLSTLGFMFGTILVIGMVVVLSTFAIALFPGINPAQTIFIIAKEAVPILVGTIIMASAAAFLITTATSYLLSASSNVVFDIYHRIKEERDKKLTQKENALYLKKDNSKSLVRFNRVIVVLLGGIAYVLGQFFPTVLTIQMYSYTMYGVTITPVIMAALFWKKATKEGALASMVIGGGATMIWELVLNRPMEWNSVLFALPLSIIALIVVSLLTSKKEEVRHG